MKLDIDRDVIMFYDYMKIPAERHKQIYDKIMELRQNCKNMGDVVEHIVEEFGGNDNELVYALVEYGVLRGKDGGIKGGWNVGKAFLARIKGIGKK